VIIPYSVSCRVMAHNTEPSLLHPVFLLSLKTATPDRREYNWRIESCVQLEQTTQSFSSSIVSGAPSAHLHTLLQLRVNCEGCWAERCKESIAWRDPNHGSCEEPYKNNEGVEITQLNATVTVE
jgi:hypothetical protein